MRVFRSSIRARLVLLVLVATVPFLLFSGALLQRAYQVSTGLVEDAAVGYARRLAIAVDAQVGRSQAVAQAVTELPVAEQGDLREFENAATRVLSGAGVDGVLALVDASGRVLARSAHSPGEAPARSQDMAIVRQVFETGRPHVSGVFTSAATRELQVGVHVPVLRNGQVRYDALILLSAHAVADVLAPQALPEGWFAIVADRQNRVIARTFNAGVGAGLEITSSFAALSAGKTEGFGAATSREGDSIFVGFTHSERTGWLIGVAVPQSVVRGPQLRSIALLAGGGALLLLTSLALAWRIGRTVAGPVDALGQQAARLGRNELPDPHAAHGLAEAEAAAQALHAAALMLRTRMEEREAALRRAEESEARLLLAQEVGQVGVWETDIPTGRRTWSEQQFRLYGLDPNSGAPHGPAWAQLIHPDDRARVLATVTRAYGEPTSYQHEFRIVQPGGAIRWLLTAGRSQFKDGAMIRLIGVAFDTTERHESERALRDSAARLEAEVTARTHELAQSEERFRTYFEHSADAMVVVRVEPDGRFVFESINKAGERLTGLRDREIAGRTPADALLPETAEDVIRTFKRVVDHGQPLTLERTLAWPSGTLELESVLVPVRDTYGRVVRIISGQRDLTERRRIEGRLAHAQRMEAVGQLTGGVAHDFNNLLTVVIGNLSLLRRRLSDDERALRYLTSVEAAADRGAKLTASLLAFSRRQTLQVQPVDVGAQLSESITLLRRALGEEIEMTLDVAPGLPLAITDTAQLEAAVLNLVINARDAILAAMARQERRSGSLQVQVREAVLRVDDLEGNPDARPGRFVAIVVQDSGVGMTAEVRARAFEPFFTTKDVGQGTGLGLSQVFGFVRQLGGHVTLDSTPGHGTRAVLYLPLAGSVAEVSAQEPAEPTPLPIGATVLVVEDDDSIREVTGEVLRDSGLEVLTAPSGPAALAILRGPARVHILFSDIVMPGGASGVDLARSARILRPGLAVLLTSGYGGPALRRYGAEGEYEVLAKPYTRTVLLERISQMLVAVPAA